MKNQPTVSIVVPTWNEETNLPALVARVDATLKAQDISYELIIVDDRSTDATASTVANLSLSYPIKFLVKNTSIARGKANSLLLGFVYAQSEIIAMIDADLQYPPEAIPAMVKKVQAGADIVVGNRTLKKNNVVRKMASFIFYLLFAHLLHGFSVDVQSGLKVLRKEIVERMNAQPTSQWMLDLELLTFARLAGYKITSFDIAFEKRFSGTAKISLVQASLEMAWNAIKMKWRRPEVIPFHPQQQKRWGKGFHFKGKQYVSHTDLHHDESAFFRFSGSQKLYMLLFTVLVGELFLLNWYLTLVGILAFLTILYFADLSFNGLLILRSFKKTPEIQVADTQVRSISDTFWPTYTVFCPLYKEWDVLPQFINAMKALDYPQEKLQIMLLLEEDDRETITHAQAAALPANFQIVIVPDSQPKTKPKALNYGLTEATGEYAVVYDAEDIPDPLQLKKAVIAFGKASPKTVCIQAKLNFYNPQHNLLTRLFSTEYSLWFELVLTGLQLIEAPIPLGGTSNHFRVHDLKNLAGWDAFNVTEDCDLGLRLTKRGYKTAIIDSVTYEEANSSFFNWFGQRSRWIKGYIQTYLVHMRSPLAFSKSRKLNVAIFQLTVGGKVLSLFINPLMWCITITYFVLRPLVGTTIESFFPVPVLYMGVLCLVFGNFVYIYSYMIGIAKRHEWWLIKYVFLVPFYWLCMSLSAWKALASLIVSPFYWSKTQHGLHLSKPVKQKVVVIPAARVIKGPSSPNPVTSGSFLIGATMLANLFNYLTNAYLGRATPVEEFGLISLVSALVTLTQIPLSSYSRTITHQAASYLGKYGTPVKKLWSVLRRQALLPSILAVAAWLAAIPFLAEYFKADTLLPFILISPLWALGIFAAVDSGFLNGSLRFYPLAIMTIAEVVGKFIITVVLVQTNLTQWVYFAYPASSLFSFLIGWWAALHIKTKPIESEIPVRLPRRFFWTTVLSKLSSTAFLSFDVILAKHYLTPTEAGQYALLSLVGKMIYFLGTLFSQFVIPLVSREEGAGRNSKAIFKTLLALTTLSVAVGYVGVGIFGVYTIPLLLGEKTLPIVNLLPLYTLAMACFSLSQTVVAYHQSRKEYVFAGVNSAFVLGMLSTVTIFHDSIHTINVVVTLGSVGSLLLAIIMHFFYERIRFIVSNILDFAGLFSLVPKPKIAKQNFRILIYNWRDTKHVWAGGAERYIQEIAQRWAAKGHQVTIFCGNDGKHARNETIEGVHIIRRGGFYTVYIWAMLYYVFKFSGNFDIVIDSENGIPFFTPFYVSAPTFLLIHHVHKEVFRHHLRFPLAQLAIALESKVMPRLYRSVPIITVSESSKKEILNLGFINATDIHVIHPGIEFKKFLPTRKTTYPSFLYLGRLQPYKHVDVAIRAFAQVFQNHQTAKFTIAGEGTSLPQLQTLVTELSLTHRIIFVGKVSEAEKIRLMSSHWMMVQPSSVEGWGMTVVEANACATPVIASNVNGLKDSVIDGTTGILIAPHDVAGFAHMMELLIENTRFRNDLSRQAREFAITFSWDDTASNFLAIITRTKKFATIPVSRRMMYNKHD